MTDCIIYIYILWHNTYYYDGQSTRVYLHAFSFLWSHFRRTNPQWPKHAKARELQSPGLRSPRRASRLILQKPSRGRARWGRRWYIQVDSLIDTCLRMIGRQWWKNVSFLKRRIWSTEVSFCLSSKHHSGIYPNSSARVATAQYSTGSNHV